MDDGEGLYNHSWSNGDADSGGDGGDSIANVSNSSGDGVQQEQIPPVVYAFMAFVLWYVVTLLSYSFWNSVCWIDRLNLPVNSAHRYTVIVLFCVVPICLAYRRRAMQQPLQHPSSSASYPFAPQPPSSVVDARGVKLTETAPSEPSKTEVRVGPVGSASGPSEGRSETEWSMSEP